MLTVLDAVRELSYNEHVYEWFLAFAVGVVLPKPNCDSEFHCLERLTESIRDECTELLSFSVSQSASRAVEAQNPIAAR